MTLSQLQHWKLVFVFKAWWNWCITVLFALVERPLRRNWGLETSSDYSYQQLFLGLAFIFGIGYWQVSRDLTRNHDIVRLGIYGQVWVFVISVYYAFAYGGRDPVHLLSVFPGTVDLVFAILFVRFLKATRPTSE
jgi:hypothetical protein